MQLENLHQLFVNELRELYSGEKQISDALPKMAKAATSRDLRRAFKDHLKETEEHLSRLEEVFEQLGIGGWEKDNDAVEGLIRLGEDLIASSAEGDTLDAGLIAAAQKVEHHEIAAYGSVRTYAEQLGRGDFVRILQRTLDEEKRADRRLSGLAESINVKARKNTRSRSQFEYRGQGGGVGGGIIKFMWGIGLGLGAGMLLAPAPGRETRSSITERATELADNAKSKYEQVRKSVTGVTEDRTTETTGT
jgi:ferritin-like metal-binding protein YciE